MFSQGGIGEKGAEGTAGNDGARVRERISSRMSYKPPLSFIILQTCFLNVNNKVTFIDLESRM